MVRMRYNQRLNATDFTHYCNQLSILYYTRTIALFINFPSSKAKRGTLSQWPQRGSRRCAGRRKHCERTTGRCAGRRKHDERTTGERKSAPPSMEAQWPARLRGRGSPGRPPALALCKEAAPGFPPLTRSLARIGESCDQRGKKGIKPT